MKFPSVPSLFRQTAISSANNANRCVTKSQLSEMIAGPATAAQGAIQSGPLTA